MTETQDRSVYLDYNATTPLEDEVLAAIHTALSQAWGNPSSPYPPGKKAKEIIINARDSLARMLSASPEDIIFTSGGTEANNMILSSVVKHYAMRNSNEGSEQSKSRVPHVITSNLEHDAVKLVLENMQQEGVAEVTYVAANKQTGSVEVESLERALQANTCLVTIMMANNETGIIQPIEEIGHLLKTVNHEKGDHRIYFHTDAAQAIGKVPVNVDELHVDYLTVAGHKFYGPRIGAVYARSPNKQSPIYPLLFGGGQERNLRPGTENTGLIAGLGKAADLVIKNIDQYETHMRHVREYLEDKLKETFAERGITFHSDKNGEKRLPNTCSVSIHGKHIHGYHILSRVRHLQASVGAACHVQNKPSAILIASGVTEELAANAVRLSVGRHTTLQDIDLVVADLKMATDLIQSEQLSS